MAEYSRDEWGATLALEELGITEAQIAEKLRQLGIKGVVRDGCRCVLAEYYRSIYGNGIDIRVDVGQIRIEGLDTADDVLIWPTTPVADLIEAFDNGDYPELIKEATA